jgi:hypothetical protein
MARTEAGTIVAMEILVEKKIIAPVRVLLKLSTLSIDWPPP